MNGWTLSYKLYNHTIAYPLWVVKYTLFTNNGIAVAINSNATSNLIRGVVPRVLELLNPDSYCRTVLIRPSTVVPCTAYRISLMLKVATIAIVVREYACNHDSCFQWISLPNLPGRTLRIIESEKENDE